MTAAVTAVDLQLGLGNTSTSGCEAADFAGFPAGNIALSSAAPAPSRLKAENAAAAGAVGVIIFNQGNTPDRTGSSTARSRADYAGGIPVVSATYDRGVEWARRPAWCCTMSPTCCVDQGVTDNVLAETPAATPTTSSWSARTSNSVREGPGINDNGCGSAAILEIALQMAQRQAAQQGAIRVVGRRGIRA